MKTRKEQLPLINHVKKNIHKKLTTLGFKADINVNFGISFNNGEKMSKLHNIRECGM